MGNMPKQPGDAVLCRDGKVKVGGLVVGVWWKDEYHWYHFASAEGAEPSVSCFFRHEFKSAIPESLTAQR